METFFFYDLETSGLDARGDRIMQFAGQRTDLNLQPIGEAVNLLVRLAEDTLPSPFAIAVTKITPQVTVADGISEAELAKFLYAEVFTPGTVALGYNSVRFDDEFLRHLFWRNFCDPYEWQWRDGRSKWDMLDVVRTCRALRPDGIAWPVDKDGKETNRLELLTKLNKLDHKSAHDALSDVNATIAVARMIREKQPQLFNWLLKMRDKKELQRMINLDDKKPFMYVSGRYAMEFHKATVAFPLTAGRNGNVLVYDLRYDPDELKDGELFPVVKELHYGRCPAVAPLAVLDAQGGWERIGLGREQLEANLAKLLAHPEIAERARSAIEERPEWPAAADSESALYDGFLDSKDRVRCEAVRNSKEKELADFMPEFDDERLPALLVHYKGRNYPKSLSEGEAGEWEKYRTERLGRQGEKFLAELASVKDKFLREELQLWYQSLMPY